jgi:uncharacterized protein
MTQTPRWWIAAATLALAGCQGGDRPPQSAPAKATVDPVFVQAQRTWRAERHASLTKPDGWTSLVGLHWIDPGPHYFGSDPGNGIRLAMGPAQAGMLDLEGGAVRLVPDKAAHLTLGGEPLKAAVTLKSDADEGGPSVLGFDDGKGIATVIKRGDRYALRVKHADAPTRLQFAGLKYWPASPGWRFDAKFVPHAAGKTIAIASIIGTLDEVPNPGAVEFERDGRTWRLEALDEGDGLFLIFADRTSGHQSYGAGRYIDAPEPDANGRVVVDFNQAYNPPCAFTPFATCPLPPPENRLDLAITAGETYAKAH